MKIYKITIDDDLELGMNAISLVDFPAVERNFIAFKEEKKPQLLNFNEAKHIISGVVALADTPIYRYHPGMGEYYVVFDKDVIRKMVERYSKNNLFNSINFQHNDNDTTDKLVLIESYFVDEERGISPKDFGDLTDGSWICSFYVEDEELWKRILNDDTLQGFSLQGIFNLEEKFSQQTIPEEKTETPQDEFNNWINTYID